MLEALLLALGAMAFVGLFIGLFAWMTFEEGRMQRECEDWNKRNSKGSVHGPR